MKEDNNNNATKEKKEVKFLKDTKAVVDNEVKNFKKNSKHKFGNATADKLVSQNVAEYTAKDKKKSDQNINNDASNTEEKEN